MVIDISKGKIRIEKVNLVVIFIRDGTEDLIELVRIWIEGEMREWVFGRK